ncbi:glycosyl hydrolase 115 family protein [Belliella kenyensis]|uniref:glycosyl hydrolase 115 family protein n=1 Tax=Belliella kenyensis TaxID=1472724 RepID=UPI0021D406DC|nr:glycosyl hydrolase 115 family protein [Belliella kenyensis]MCH7402013.1 glycosyl hydrolase 115 family protein [Belliella kenyensis]MDN3605177.1 glycosyl hydrolase 115 family protein [Belliella kenyensis]
MHHLSRFILIFCFAIIVSFQAASQIGTASFVSPTSKLKSFPLVDEELADLVFDGKDEGIAIAVENLQKDINRVTGKQPKIQSELLAGKPQVIIGQLGESKLIDHLVKEGKIKAASLSGKWETFQVLTVEHPFEGVDQALVIVGSDKRGTIFGIYELSEQIGVSPWYWWADVPVKKHSKLFVDHGVHTKGTPAVKYRGIFINDEAPALAGWATKQFGGFNHKFYENVFELILRLRGNYLWPAMWGRAFYDDDKLNGPMADKYGVVIGTSHHEPLMRAHAEWSRYGKGDWDYQTNKEELQDFWRKGMERQGSMESTVSLGMRGDGDEPMSEENNIALLEQIIEDQRRIIEEVTGKPASETPQFWALYKEVQEYYDKGMRVPDDVTLLLCDDNWGNVRKLPTIGAPARKGGYGMYYHFDYVGGPRNYKWINTNPIPKIWEQMDRTYRHGVDELWVVNVGDIKPMEFPISFFLDFAWNPNAIPAVGIDAYTKSWSASQFGQTYANQIADLIAGFGKLSGRRKPELLDQNTYSVHYYGEMSRVSAEWQALEELCADIKEKLDPSYHDAYFQLVEHPIIASANLHRLYESTALNQLYAKQGRNLTNKKAEEVHAFFKRDAEISAFYNNELAGGKWPHMMDQTHIGYTYWQQPNRDKIPDLNTIEIASKGALGVAISDSPEFFPENKILKSVVLSPYDPYHLEVTLFNKGNDPITVKSKSFSKWLSFEVGNETIATERAIPVKIDWNLAPKGKHVAKLEISSGKEKVLVEIPIYNYLIEESFTGFVPYYGVVAMEADHFTSKHEENPIKWEILDDMGKTGNAVMATPMISHTESTEVQGSYISYDVWMEEAGTYEVQVYTSPTLNYLNASEGLQYGIAANESTPTLVSIHENERPHHWNNWVANSINISRKKVEFQKGKNELKIYLVNPGIIFQRIIIDTGNLKSSYLGPKESVFVH